MLSTASCLWRPNNPHRVAEADGFRRVESTVHGSGGIGAENRNRYPAALLDATDGTALWTGIPRRSNSKPLSKRFGLGRISGDDEADRTCVASKIPDGAISGRISDAAKETWGALLS